MSVLPPLAASSLIFLLGLFVGSFLNVCIWRMPQGEQVIRGRSHCRGCGQAIRWYDNIPLVSFLLLRGRCRFCQARISWIYPAVELGTGLLFLATWLKFGATIHTLVYSMLGAALILVSVVDARTMEIPDQVTIQGMELAGILSFVYPALQGQSDQWAGLGSSVLGVLSGAGVMVAMGLLGRQLFRRKLRAIGEEEALGFGDVKLMAMVGAALGAPKVLLVTLLLGPLLGTVGGIPMKLATGRDLIPYGPFLAAATLVAIFWGEGIFAWYRQLWWG